MKISTSAFKQKKYKDSFYWKILCLTITVEVNEFF